MLHALTSSRLDNFANWIEGGHIKSHPQFRYYRLHFNLDHYDDDAFKTHGIACPPNIYRSVPKRRAEYLAGRICCKLLLEGFGISAPVSSDASRAPCWPDGFKGSISHCDGHAIAVLTRAENGDLGVDIELLHEEILLESADLIAGGDERTLLESSLGLGKQWALLLAFSAKESLFKASYSTVKRYLGFEHAHITSIEPSQGKIALQFSSGILPNNFWPTIQGSYYFEEGRVITFVFLEKPPEKM